MEIETAREILRIKTGSPEELLDRCDAIWVYSGQKGEPHALLTPGKHSDGYINLNAVLQFPNLCEILAKKTIEKLENECHHWIPIDVVVSSSFAAIPFGKELARQLGAMFVFTEKEGKDQKWTGRFELPKGAVILQAEELVTTLGTTRKVKEAILNNNPKVYFLELNGKTVVLTIVHRPVKLPITYPDYEVISLVEKEIHTWNQKECPLCKEGSRALKPKPNWQEFLSYRLSGTL